MAYDFVSNVGTHNKDLPDPHDVDFGIGLIERSIKYVIDASSPRPKTVKIVRTQQIQIGSDATFVSKENEDSRTGKRV